jgi:hypothetical protein
LEFFKIVLNASKITAVLGGTGAINVKIDIFPALIFTFTPYFVLDNGEYIVGTIGGK